MIDFIDLEMNHVEDQRNDSRLRAEYSRRLTEDQKNPAKFSDELARLSHLDIEQVDEV